MEAKDDSVKLDNVQEQTHQFDMYAFPCKQWIFNGRSEMSFDTPGLTKREYFAGLAMQALSSKTNAYSTTEAIAVDSVKLSDALINELNKEK